jgi:hypothetical protein
MQIIWCLQTPEQVHCRQLYKKKHSQLKHHLPIWWQYSRQTWSSVISGWHKLQVKCVLLLQLPSKHRMLQTVHHQQDFFFKRNTQAIAPGQVITTIYLSYTYHGLSSTPNSKDGIDTDMRRRRRRITTIYYIAACIPQLVIATMYQVLCCHLTFQFPS